MKKRMTDHSIISSSVPLPPPRTSVTPTQGTFCLRRGTIRPHRFTEGLPLRLSLREIQSQTLSATGLTKLRLRWSHQRQDPTKVCCSTAHRRKCNACRYCFYCNFYCYCCCCCYHYHYYFHHYHYYYYYYYYYYNCCCFCCYFCCCLCCCLDPPPS